MLQIFIATPCQQFPASEGNYSLMITWNSLGTEGRRGLLFCSFVEYIIILLLFFNTWFHLLTYDCWRGVLNAFTH